MMKSLKNMLKQDKEKYTVPRSVHDYIPITAIPHLEERLQG